MLENQVVITIRNNLFSKSYRAMIKPVSSIKGLTPIIDNTVTGKNELKTLRFSFESLGEPSCSLITQDTNGFKNFLFTIGSDQDTCRAYYPYIEFKEKYQIAESKIWIFTFLLKEIGLVNIEAFIKNEYSSASISSSITVSNFDCNRPQVEIENRSSFFYHPRIIPRSKRFSIVGITKINCKLSLQNIRQWTLFSVKESNGEVIQQISIVSNPTSSFSELVIPSKILPFGLYKFVFKVKMLGQNIDLTAFQVEIDTYVKIVPSGIVVQVFPGGMTKIRRGIDQNIILDPTFYSYDLDSVFPIKNLKFKYFCSIFENGILVKSPQISLDKSIDLSSIKSDFQRYSNNSCFDSAELFSFDITSNVLNIPARGLSYVPSRQYMFTIMTSYLQKNYSQNVFLEIDSYSNVPVINIRCKFIKECSPHENYLLVNPISKLMITGECESGCEYINSFEYEYRIFKRWIISDLDNREKWQLCFIWKRANIKGNI
ncbi:polycystin-1-like isoform X2 [Brachionus plicatilis]|uniref:Polycystin-1-like isoform X2 n=1 Tax=Brachionus plicatilis TaxID=10195 RepID=A0A3M7QFH7_BRAPC|nr:polycystin-1-like isoform X2 [Brachionus plicatilis]